MHQAPVNTSFARYMGRAFKGHSGDVRRRLSDGSCCDPGASDRMVIRTEDVAEARDRDQVQERLFVAGGT
jgi:hypothetical protein